MPPALLVEPLSPLLLPALFKPLLEGAVFVNPIVALVAPPGTDFDTIRLGYTINSICGKVEPKYAPSI